MTSKAKKTAAVGVVGLAAGAALAFGVIGVGANDTFNQQLLKGRVENAETQRKYHRERVQYYIDNNIPTLDKAIHGRDKFESDLLKEGWTNELNGAIRKPQRVSAIERRDDIAQNVYAFLADWTYTAYAFTFGKEDFESCISLPCTYDSNVNWGSITNSLDSTSKVNGVDSFECAITGEGGCYLLKDIGTPLAEVYSQWVGRLDTTSWSFGASGYIGMQVWEDASNVDTIFMNLENYGADTYRLTVNGDVLGYTNTGINLVEDANNRIELYINISATVGDIKVWLGNDTEGSPDFDCSTCTNTGTDSVEDVHFGIYYVPDDTDDWWSDDGIVDTAFIGAGAVAAVEGVNSFQIISMKTP